MFLPIGDEPRLRGTPVVTYALIALNVAVYVLISAPLTGRGVDVNDPALLDYLRYVILPRLPGAEGVSPEALLYSPALYELRQGVLQAISSYDLLVFELGFKPGGPSLLDLFASMFLHAGVAHLGGNMLFLWLYGRNVESQGGRVGFLALYLLTGVAATSLHALFQLGSMIPMVGASGAISGVLGVYFLWFPRNKVRVLIFFGFFIQVVSLPARFVLGVYLVADNLLPFLLADGATGVAYGAHIGGFAGGLAGAALYKRWHARSSVFERAGAAGDGAADSVADLFGSGTPASPTDAFRKAVSSGQFALALRLYVDLPARARLTLDADNIMALADWLGERGQLDAALAILQRFVATHPTSEALAAAHLRLGHLHLVDDRLPAAYQHFLAVLDLRPTGSEEAEARRGLATVDERVRAARRLRLN